GFGVLCLSPRWAWRSILLVALFAAGGAVAKGEPRLAFPGLAGVCVLAAGAVVWTGRAATRLLGDERRVALVQGGLAALLVGAAFCIVHAELWGDYSFLRAWLGV